MLMPFLAQARLVASSPAGWAIACIPAGETPSGNAILLPRTWELVSMLDTSRSTRVRKRYLLNAAAFSRSVTCSVAPEL